MTFSNHKIVLAVLLFMSSVTSVMAQQSAHLEFELTAEGALSSGTYTPYMLTVNRFDVLSPRANTGYMSAGINGDLQFTKHWNVAGGLTAMSSVHSNHKAYLQELYFNATYRKVNFEVGVRQRNTPTLNALLTSGDLIFSGNAKPIPTFHVSTTGFVEVPYLKKWLEAYADFGYGRLFDQKYTEDRFELFHKSHFGSFFTRDVYFHHKQLYLRSNSSHPFYVTVGMQHAVYFGGVKTSYDTGEKKESGKKKIKPADFMRVLIPKSDATAGNAGDSFVYGNHLGIWYLDFNYQRNNHLLRAYMEKPFEDGSGIAFRNGLDGLWGFEYASKQTSGIIPVKGIVFEYLQTTNQSGPIHWAPGDFNSEISQKLPSEATGADNYYNNFFYNGYCYYGLSVGSALLKSPYYNEDNYLNYTDNRVQAWHLGVNGDITAHFGYLLKSSYREGLGTPFVPLPVKNHSFDSLIQVDWHQGPWQCAAAFAITQGNIYGNTYGFDVKITYHGKIL